MAHLLRELFKELEAKGWTIEKTKKHVKLRHEVHGLVFCSSSPSCHRAEDNVRSDVRKAERGLYKTR